MLSLDWCLNHVLLTRGVVRNVSIIAIVKRLVAWFLDHRFTLTIAVPIRVTLVVLVCPLTCRFHCVRLVSVDEVAIRWPIPTL